MERVVVYKPYKNWSKVQMYVGTFLLIVGTIFLIHHFLSNSSDGQLWSSSMIMLQGLLFLILGYSRKMEKYFFIEWDEQEIRYLLMKDKSTQTIRISEIKSVNGNGTEIRINLAGTEKILHLEGIFYQDMKKVKELLQTLQKMIDNRKQDANS